MLRLLRQLAYLPKEYEISIIEAHHSKKRDSPSGTALSMAKLISDIKGYNKIIQVRDKSALRSSNELEILSIRAGGIPGTHEVIAAGPHDMICLSYISFSRSSFALGALHAAEWIMKKEQTGVYSMEDVLSSFSY